MRNIRKDIIPCAYNFDVAHYEEMHNNLVDNLYLLTSLRVEGSQFGWLGVDH